MQNETTEVICTCADGTIAGAGVVVVFIAIVVLPALYEKWVDARRNRAIANALQP